MHTICLHSSQFDVATNKKQTYVLCERTLIVLSQKEHWLFSHRALCLTDKIYLVRFSIACEKTKKVTSHYSIRYTISVWLLRINICWGLFLTSVTGYTAFYIKVNKRCACVFACPLSVSPLLCVVGPHGPVNNSILASPFRLRPDGTPTLPPFCKSCSSVAPVGEGSHPQMFSLVPP